MLRERDLEGHTDGQSLRVWAVDGHASLAQAVIKAGVPESLLLLHSSFMREAEIPDELKNFTVDEKFNKHHLHKVVYQVSWALVLFRLALPQVGR